jgi:hypothetical protein
VDATNPWTRLTTRSTTHTGPHPQWTTPTSRCTHTVLAKTRINLEFKATHISVQMNTHLLKDERV